MEELKNELLPCPFCGGESRNFYRVDRTHQADGTLNEAIYAHSDYVICSSCGASAGGYSYGLKCQTDSIKAWNTRVESKPCEKCKEHEVELNAWYKTFGTTQLTHAIARLEKAERLAESKPVEDVAELRKELIKYMDGLKIRKDLINETKRDFRILFLMEYEQLILDWLKTHLQEKK